MATAAVCALCCGCLLMLWLCVPDYALTPPAACVWLLASSQDLAHQVAPLLLSHPLLASVPLAEHVEAAAVSGRLPAGALLAEQLLVRLGAHEARCRLLLRHGRIKAALLAAKRHGLLELVQPALREAAALSGSFLLRAAVHRCCRGDAPRTPLSC